MSHSVGWMPELIRRLNEACAESFVFATVGLGERLPAGKQLCLELWPFIRELPVNIQAVRQKMPIASSNLDGANKLLSVLADEEHLYQRLYIKQCVLAGISESEVLNTPASPRAIRLASLMNTFCQESKYADGVYAIVAAELAATAFARCALPWFEEYFRSNSNGIDSSTIDEGLAWLRHHAKPHLRQAIWMRRMLEEIEKDSEHDPTRQTLEVILSAVFEILEVPQIEKKQDDQGHCFEALEAVVEMIVNRKLNSISIKNARCFALCFLAAVFTGGAQPSVSSASADSASTATPTETTDGKPFIDKCLKASDSYADYTFNYVQHVSKGSGVTEKGTVWVKKPGMLKCDVSSGPNSGAVAIFNNGVVHAHPGGLLKVFTVALKPDDSRLKSANGWPMVESDFSSIWKAMEKYSKEGCPSKVSAEPVSMPSQSINVFVLEMTKANGQMYKRALVDPKTMLPVEWWDYVDGKVYAHSNWTGFKGNQGLSETFFTMKGK